jgi:acyl dehydratase
MRLSRSPSAGPPTIGADGVAEGEACGLSGAASQATKVKSAVKKRVRVDGAKKDMLSEVSLTSCSKLFYLERHLRMGEARPFGRYYEDFEIGDVYKHWPGKTITEYDDHLFCMITMNHHPLHSNLHFAETQTHFKRNVVVGNLVYSLALGMSVPDVSGRAIANLEVETLQHKAPFFHGDTLYAQTTVLDKKESSSKPDRGVVTVETKGFNQRGEEVLYFRRRVMVWKKSEAPESFGDWPITEA